MTSNRTSLCLDTTSVSYPVSLPYFWQLEVNRPAHSLLIVRFDQFRYPCRDTYNRWCHPTLVRREPVRSCTSCNTEVSCHHGCRTLWSVIQLCSSTCKLKCGGASHNWPWLCTILFFFRADCAGRAAPSNLSKEYVQGPGSHRNLSRCMVE